MIEPDLVAGLYSSHPALKRVMAVLNIPDEESRIVGGAVRNALLGLAVSEIDIATTALPQKTMTLAAAAGFKTVPTGIDHGTVTVIVDGEPFEVTTLREDIETDGRHAVVRFGRSFEADALRRDFTINALSLGMDGKLHDYTNGCADIQSRSVRFIGEADARIREDYLRILRFFRFSAAYAEKIEVEGSEACARQGEGLKFLSRERIGHEMRKLLVAKGAAMALRAMQGAQLLALALPEATDLDRFARVVDFEETARLAPGVVRRLAALAHGPDAIDGLQDSLRLSNQESERLAGAFAASTAWRAGHSADAVLYRHGRPAALDGLCLAIADGFPPHDAVPLASSLETRAIPVNPFHSRHFVEKGIEPGPRLGQALRHAERRWIDEGFPNATNQVAAIIEDVAGSILRTGRAS